MIRYAYPAAVTETWRNGPLGLEQGFVLSQRPAGNGALSIAMTAPATSLLLRGAVLLPGGLRYAGLRVSDASGRVLHSWLALAHGQLLIKVSDRGAHYPVRIDPLVQQANVTAKDGVVGDYFGSSVAVSGHTLVAGAPYHKVGVNSNEGAVYVFSDRSGHWKQIAELAVAGGSANLYFGSTVGISGNTIVASAPYAGAASQGALYVFGDGSGRWKQIAELTASDAVAGDQLGHYSVAIQGKTIVAGSPAHAVNSISGQGAVYVFNEPSGGWHTMTQSAELSEAHGALDDWVGWSVGISGNTIVAGAPAPYEESNHHAAVFVFTKRSGHWKQTGEVHQRDASINNDIGQEVAISGHTIAAGAPESNNLYIFQSASGKWKQTADLTYNVCDSTECSGDSLGTAVAFAGNAIVAGAAAVRKNDYVAAFPEYREFSGKWRQVATLFAGANQHSTAQRFAEALASSGTTVVAGVFNGVDTGSVVVLKGRVTSEGPLIGQIGSGAAGEAGVPVTCELPAHSTCRVTIGVHRSGSKQVMGHAKPKNIQGTDIRTITVHFNAAFERLLSRPKGVKVTFTVRETSHGKLKASGSSTVQFIPE